MSSDRLRQSVAGLITGFLFGLGLCLAGMTRPAVILGFLDVAGNWNPALVFVMAGGVTVTFFGYRLAFRRGKPLWAESFSLPTARAIDRPLLLGAVIFGIGWGLAGYCPGPAVTSLAGGRAGVGVFVIAMIGGMVVMRWLRKSRSANVALKPAGQE